MYQPFISLHCQKYFSTFPSLLCEDIYGFQAFSAWFLKKTIFPAFQAECSLSPEGKLVSNQSKNQKFFNLLKIWYMEQINHVEFNILKKQLHTFFQAKAPIEHFCAFDKPKVSVSSHSKLKLRYSFVTFNQKRYFISIGGTKVLKNLVFITVLRMTNVFPIQNFKKIEELICGTKLGLKQPY